MTTTLTGAGETELLDGATVNAGYFDVFGIAPDAWARVPGRERIAPGSNGVAILGHALWMRRFGGDPRHRRASHRAGRPVHHRRRRAAGAGAAARPATTRRSRPAAANDRHLPADRPAARSAAVPRRSQLRRGRAHPPGRERRRILRSELDALEPAVSRADGRRRAQACAGPAAAAGRGAARARSVDRALRGDRRGPAHRLRQPGESAARAARRTPARGGDPDGARRRTRYARRRRARGERAARGRRRRRRRRSRLVFHAGDRLDRPTGAADCSTRSRSTRACSSFCVASTLAAGLTVGILPGRCATARVDPGRRPEGQQLHDHRRTRAAAARAGPSSPTQAAIGAALLVTTGLLVLSFVRLMHVDKGFDTAGILTVDVALPPSTFTTADQQLRFFDAALARVRALPGRHRRARSRAVCRCAANPPSTCCRFRTISRRRPPVRSRIIATSHRSTSQRSARRSSAAARSATPIADARSSSCRPAPRRRSGPGRTQSAGSVKTGGYLGARERSDRRRGRQPRRRPHAHQRPVHVPALLAARPLVSVARHSDERCRRRRWPLPPAGRSGMSTGRSPFPRVETMADIVAVSVADRRFQLVPDARRSAAPPPCSRPSASTAWCRTPSRGAGVRWASASRWARVPGDIHRLVIAEGLAPVAAGVIAGARAFVVDRPRDRRVALRRAPRRPRW